MGSTSGKLVCSRPGWWTGCAPPFDFEDWCGPHQSDTGAWTGVGWCGRCTRSHSLFPIGPKRHKMMVRRWYDCAHRCISYSIAQLLNYITQYLSASGCCRIWEGAVISSFYLCVHHINKTSTFDYFCIWECLNSRKSGLCIMAMETSPKVQMLTQPKHRGNSSLGATDGPTKGQWYTPLTSLMFV